MFVHVHLRFIALICSVCSFFFIHSLFSLRRVYSGHHTFLLNPYDLDINPSLWLSVVSNNKGTLPFRHLHKNIHRKCCKQLCINNSIS